MAVGDLHYYRNGTPWVETDGGPNVITVCAQCGASANAHLDMKASAVLCGTCMASKHGMLPGQQGYLLKQQWIREQQGR